jgi:Tetratricopeptide repeat
VQGFAVQSPAVTAARDREALEQAVVRGSELLKQGKLDHAQRAFRAALELEPENPRVLALLGLAHFRAHELADARGIYEQLVAASPTDASHRLNLGLVYLKLNDADRAIGALEASRALDPSQGRAVSYLGLAYARAGRYGEAYRAFLIAGQTDLATEIESNLAPAERDRIHSQLGRAPYSPDAPPASPRTPTPTSASRTPTPPRAVAAARAGGAASAPRTPTPVPRAKPPSAPPRRTPSQELAVASSPEIAIRQDAAGPERIGGTRSADDRGDPAPREPDRITDSTQFVIPRADPAAPAEPGDNASMISRAVASATPSPAAGVRTAAGGVAPRPLSELATDELLRPDDGADAFELGANGTLIMRVSERVLTRLDGIHVTGGDLSFERAMRRSRGHNTEEPFDHGGSQLHAVSGRGYLIAVPGKHAFSAITLDDDILYLREDLVFAFEASLRWENGNVPGLRGKLPVVQFRGDGALALRLARPLVRIKLPAQGTVFVDAERLAGWIGRVIPRAVVPPPGGPLGAMCVECTGEGVVLVEPEDAAGRLAIAPPAHPPLPAGRPPGVPAEPPPLPTRTAPIPVAPGADTADDALNRLDEL